MPNSTNVRIYGRDVTARREMEQRLAVQERLAYLGRMAGTIAHEVRNPLAVIDSSAYYLEHSLKDAGDKTQEHLQRVRWGVVRAALIIEKLLEMSRMKEPQMKRIKLSRFASDIVSAARITPGVHVTTDFKEVEVQADEVQLGMVLGNLIKNAVEAMPADQDKFSPIPYTVYAPDFRRLHGWKRDTGEMR